MEVSPPLLIAVGATLALIGFAVALVAAMVRRDWRRSAWALVPLVMAGVTALLAGVCPPLHLAASLVTLGAALGNVVQFKGAVCAAEALGAGGWLAAVVAARVLFSP